MYNRKRNKHKLNINADYIRTKVGNIMGKENKSTTDKSNKSNKKKTQYPVLFGIMGLGVAIVIASMAFSCYLVIIGTKTMTPKYFLIPQLLAAVGVVGTVFYKAFSNIK